MSLVAQLNQDMKDAMKLKDKEKLSVIRMLKASLQKEQIEVGRELTAEEELTILSRELKQRRDSVAEFTKADRLDLAEKTQQEITVVMAYMPEQLSEEEIKKIIMEAITTVGAHSSADFGKVMGVVMPKTKGKADGNVVNRLVKELLA